MVAKTVFVIARPPSVFISANMLEISPFYGRFVYATYSDGGGDRLGGRVGRVAGVDGEGLGAHGRVLVVAGTNRDGSGPVAGPATLNA